MIDTVIEALARLLPHWGAALVIASIVLTLTKRFIASPMVRLTVFCLMLIVCLVPLPTWSLTHYARILTGDLSITSFIWLLVVARLSIQDPASARPTRDIAMAAALVATALVLYPTALGFGPYDLYKIGYQPTVLAAIAFTLFAYCIVFNQVLPALILIACLAAYSLRVLESDNLWDYLMDPIITFYALSVLVRERARIVDIRPSERQVEVLITLIMPVTVITALTFGVSAV